MCRADWVAVQGAERAGGIAGTGLNPATHLHVGTGATDFVVALAAAGVISHTSSLDALSTERVELVTCIDADFPDGPEIAAAVRRLCDISDDVIFRPAASASQRPDEWVELFASVGHYRDVEFDADPIAPGAWRMRRTGDPVRVVAAYQRALQARERDVSRGESHLSATQAVLVATEKRLRERDVVAARFEKVQAGAAWKVVTRLNNVAKKIIPPGTRRRDVAKNVAQVLDLGPRAMIAQRRSDAAMRARGDQRVFDEYQAWLAINSPTLKQLAAMRTEAAGWSDAPLLSIVMPTYKPDLTWFREAIQSVVDQAYTKWQLCIADDGSQRPDIRELLNELTEADPRIPATLREANGGIVAASRSALELATGDFAVLMDHDDIIHPHALFALVKYWRAHPDVDVIYSDEDKLMQNGTRDHPYFKPDWSPEMLRAWNYVGHLTAIRRELLIRVGGFRDGYDGSQDHDLLLRATDVSRNVGHIPDVLYSWRQVAGSVALNEDAKPYARDSGLRAVQASLERNGQRATAAHARQAGLYDVRYEIAGNPKVTILIPTRDRVDLVRMCIDSIRRLSTYSNYEIVVIDNDSRDPETVRYLARSGLQIVRHPGPFNYSRIVNHGVRETSGDYVLMLNNDIEVTTPAWIQALVELGQRPRVGAVGGRLLFPDLRVQHEGIGIGLGYIAGNMAHDKRVIREVSAVTGACMLVPRQAWESVGGFDDTLGVALNDVDFCLRLGRAGYSILYTPHAELIHHESASRGKLDPVTDHEAFLDRWGGVDELVDPFVGPHLRMVCPLSIRLAER